MAEQESAAQRLFQQAVLVAKEVPPGTQLGIDCKAWTTGPKFMGIKMIPPGVHFVYHSAVDTMSSATLSASPRSGFFIVARDHQAILTTWSKETERLEPQDLSEEDEQRIRDDLPNLDRFLGVYPAGDDFEKWRNLSYCITPELVDRLQPPSKHISSVTEMQGVSGVMAKRRQPTDTGPQEPSRASTLKDAWQTLQPVEHMRIRFTEIPERLFPPNASPADRTKHSMDRSYTVETLLDQHYASQEELIGELQFAFVCFLIGQVYAGFEQWKRMVHLLCSCDDAMVAHPKLYLNFLNTLRYQLRETPSDFFVDIVSSNNFLVQTLKSLFLRAREAEGLRPDVKQEAERLKTEITSYFGWSFDTSEGGDMDDDDDEDGPVVVDLDEHLSPAS